MHTWTLFSLLNRCQTSPASSISSLCLFYCPFLLFFFFLQLTPAFLLALYFVFSHSATNDISISGFARSLQKCYCHHLSEGTQSLLSLTHVDSGLCCFSLSPPTSPALISLMLPFTATSSSLPSFQAEEQSVDIGVGPNMSSTWLRGGNESQEKQPGSESDN